MEEGLEWLELRLALVFVLLLAMASDEAVSDSAKFPLRNMGNVLCAVCSSRAEFSGTKTRSGI